jgi:hypothetical protein
MGNEGLGVDQLVSGEMISTGHFSMPWVYRIPVRAGLVILVKAMTDNRIHVSQGISNGSND